MPEMICITQIVPYPDGGFWCRVLNRYHMRQSPILGESEAEVQQKADVLAAQWKEQYESPT
jgi:hypothetical protein